MCGIVVWSALRPIGYDGLDAAYAATGLQTRARLGDWTDTEASPEERAAFVDLFRALHSHLELEDVACAYSV